MGGFVPILVYFGNFYLMAFGAGAGGYRIHLPHNISQFIHLRVIQRSDLRPILRASNLGGKYSEDVLPIDGEFPVVRGGFHPVMGVGVLYLLNVGQIFPVEGRHRLRYTGTGPRGVGAEKQAEAGADDQGD